MSSNKFKLLFLIIVQLLLISIIVVYVE